MVEMNTPVGTSLPETDRIASQVTKVLEGGPDNAVRIDESISGTSAALAVKIFGSDSTCLRRRVRK